MPTYVIGGKRITTAQELSDEQIDEIAADIGVAPVVPKEELRQTVQAVKPVERTIGQEAIRQVGLTARHTLEGLGSLPQMIGAPMEALGVKGSGGNIGEMFADYLGLSKPENSLERIVGAGSRAMASGLPMMKGGQILEASKFAPEVSKRVGSVMASQPSTQFVAAGASGVGSESAKEGGLGTVGQTVAGVVTPMVTVPAVSLVQGAGRVAKNIVAPMVSDAAAERGAARLALRAADRRGSQVAEALTGADKSSTAGQVAAAIDNADIAALQSIANSNDATLADTISRGVQHRIKTARGTLETRLAPVRNEAFSLARTGGVDVQPIINRIDTYRSTPGNRLDDVLQNVTGEIRAKLNALTEGGAPDPEELHTLRKQLGSTIAKHSKENADWDKKKASGVERVLQLAIDDAMDKAIGRADPSKGKLWSEGYMGEYAKGSKVIRNVEDALTREKELASAGMTTVRKRVYGAENPVKGLNLLDRAVTLLNAATRAAEGAAGAKVERKLSQMMAPSEMGGDKAKLGKLMMDELNRPQTFAESIKFRKGPTRAELGYGIEDMAVPIDTPRPKGQIVPYISPTEVVDGVPNFTFGKPDQPAPKVTAVGEDLSTPRIGMSQEPVGGQMGALRAEDARVLATQRKAAAAQDAAEAAKQSASRQPTGRGVQFDLDPVTGKLVPTSQGVKGATPEIWQANTGANLKSASEKAAAGRGFDMTAAEKVAWNKTSVDLKTVSPEFSKLTDKQILAKMQDREWVQDALNKAQQKAAMYDVLERQSQDRLAQSLARINREKMLDMVEQLQDTLGSRPSSRGYTQGDKTRKFQRGMLTDMGDPK